MSNKVKCSDCKNACMLRNNYVFCQGYKSVFNQTEWQECPKFKSYKPKYINKKY